MNKLIGIFLLLVIVSGCNCPDCPDCPSSNCSELADKYIKLSQDWNELTQKYNDLLVLCDTVGIPLDSCEYPDTFRIYIDTVPISIYQNCFWCIKDSFEINSELTAYIDYDNDTFIVRKDPFDRYYQLRRYKLTYIDTTLYRFSNQYFRPLVENEDYTDIKVFGFSDGVHHGQHDYEFAGTRNKINGTDSLIKAGKLIYYDLPVEHIKTAFYTIRVMQSLETIETVELYYFNDQSQEYTDPEGNTTHEDMNLYLTGLEIGGVDYFSPDYIEKNSNYGWTNLDTLYICVNKGNVLINLKGHEGN